MEVVVELPGLVADPQVVGVLLDDVVEDHEVGEEDLVHAPPGLEAVQVVLGALALDVARLAGQSGGGGMDVLASGLEDGGDWVLGKPVDLQVGMQPAQLLGDGHIPAGVSQPDG